MKKIESDLLRVFNESKQKGTLPPSLRSYTLSTSDGLYLLDSEFSGALAKSRLKPDTSYIQDFLRSNYRIISSNYLSFKAWILWLSAVDASDLSSWDLKAKESLKLSLNPETNTGLLGLFFRKHGINKRQLCQIIEPYSQFHPQPTQGIFSAVNATDISEPIIKVNKEKFTDEIRSRGRYYLQKNKLLLKGAEAMKFVVRDSGTSLNDPASIQSLMEITPEGYRILDWQGSELFYQLLKDAKNDTDISKYLQGLMNDEKSRELKRINDVNELINKSFHHAKNSLTQTLKKFGQGAESKKIENSYIKKIALIADKAEQLTKTIEINLVAFTQALRVMQTYLGTSLVITPSVKAVIEEYYNLLLSNELDLFNSKFRKFDLDKSDAKHSNINLDKLEFQYLHVIATAPAQLQFDCNAAEFLGELNDLLVDPKDIDKLELGLTNAKVYVDKMLKTGHSSIILIDIQDLVRSYLQLQPHDRAIEQVEVLKWLFANSHLCRDFNYDIDDSINKFMDEFLAKTFTEIKQARNKNNSFNPQECQRLINNINNAEDLSETFNKPEFSANIVKNRQFLLDHLAKDINREIRLLTKVCSQANRNKYRYDYTLINETAKKLQKTINIYQSARPDHLNANIWVNQIEAIVDFSQSENELVKNNALNRLVEINNGAVGFIREIEKAQTAEEIIEIVNKNKQLLVFLHANKQDSVHDDKLIAWITQTFMIKLGITDNEAIHDCGRKTVGFIRLAKKMGTPINQAIEKVVKAFENQIEKFNNNLEKYSQSAVTSPLLNSTQVQMLQESKLQRNQIDNEKLLLPESQAPQPVIKNSTTPEIKAALKPADQDPQVAELIASLQAYKIKRQAHKSDYYGLQCWGRMFNGFTQQEKFTAVDNLIKFLQGDDNQSLNNRQLKALNQGDLGKIIRNSKCQELKVILEQTRKETITAIL